MGALLSGVGHRVAGDSCALEAGVDGLLSLPAAPGDEPARPVSVVLNGQKVHDNATLEGITGGALDANETEAGPVMLQGDHGKVWYRKVIVTPITRIGS